MILLFFSITFGFVLSIAKVVHSINSFFEFELKIELELSILAHGVGFVEILVLKLIIGFLFKIKSDGVVTSCDGSYIEVYKLVHLHALHVVQVDKHIEVGKDHHAPNKETIYLSLLESFFWDNARVLSIEGSTITTFSDIPSMLIVCLLFFKFFICKVSLNCWVLEELCVKNVFV